MLWREHSAQLCLSQQRVSFVFLVSGAASVPLLITAMRRRSNDQGAAAAALQTRQGKGKQRKSGGRSKVLTRQRRLVINRVNRIRPRLAVTQMYLFYIFFIYFFMSLACQLVSALLTTWGLHSDCSNTSNCTVDGFVCLFVCFLCRLASVILGFDKSLKNNKKNKKNLGSTTFPMTGHQ